MEGVTIYLSLSLHRRFLFPSVSCFFDKTKSLCGSYLSREMQHIRHLHKKKNNNTRTDTHAPYTVHWLHTVSYSNKALHGRPFHYKDLLTSSGRYISLRSPEGCTHQIFYRSINGSYRSVSVNTATKKKKKKKMCAVWKPQIIVFFSHSCFYENMLHNPWQCESDF